MAQITYGSITVSDLTDGKNANIWTTTVAPTTPDYTFNISNLTGSDDEPREGDIILYDVYRYTISSIGATTVLAGNRQSLQGEPGTPGSPGAPGSPGTPGASVTKTETEYYRKLAGGQAPQPSTTGSTTIPEYVDGCTYYTRTVTYLSVGGPVKGEWLKATTLTNQIKDAYEAWIAAGAVEQKAKSIVQDSSGVTVAAGVNGADVTPGTTSTYGYNTIMAPTYLGLRYNAINLAKLSTTESTPELQFYFPSFSGSSNTPVQGDKGLTLGTSGMNFYHAGSNTADATLNSNGLTVSNGSIVLGTTSGTSAGNVTLSNKNFTRAINGTSHNDLRFAIGSKFGVASDGTLYSSGLDSVVSRVDIAETSLGDKVDTSTFNTLSQTVDGNSASITTLTTTTQTLREDLDGLEIGGRNLILNTATPRVSPASASGSAYVATTPTLSNYGFNILNNTDDYWTYSFDYEVTGNSADTAFVHVQMKGGSIGASHYVYIKDAPTGHFSETFKLSATQVSSTSKSCGIRLRYATDGAVLTVKNIKLEKGNKATDWSPAPEDMEETVTTISNTVNTVSQTATSNSSHISQLTTTLGTNADGTTKAGDIMHKMSDVTQDLDGFKTTVSQTYETKSDANDVRTRLSTAETNIDQNAEAITLRATKTEAVQMSKPNLSPFFQSAPFTTSAGYWTNISTSFTPLEDGWAHFSCDNTSGTDTVDNYIRMVSCPSVFDGESYTCLVEIRNLVSNARSASMYTQQSKVGQFWGSTSTGGFGIANRSMTNGSYYMPMTALGISEYGTDGTRLMYINWVVPAGAKIEADIRISLYEGEYTGEYKPYVGAQMYASQAELKVANDAISLKVSQDDVINSINVSTEGITIDADKVNITGATIFKSGRLSESSLNNAYDVKDAAANALESAKGYVDGKGYQTATDVSGAVATGVSGKADKSDAVARQQRIYYRKTSSGAPSKNTTWLSTSGTGYGNWSLKIPQLTSGTTKYPYLYTAVQTQTVAQMAAGNACACSAVLLDDTTTVIDGGHITTGTIDSNRLNADTIKVNAANIQGSLTIGQLPSTVAETSDIPTKVSELSNDSGYQTASDVSGAIVSTTTLYYASNSTTAPNKPTAHVTTNSASTRGAWNIALPAYNASYPYLYVCTETKTKGGAYAWTSVEQTTYASAISAIKTTADGAAPKSSAIAEEQRIYYRSNSSTKPNGNGLPTTWVTETGDKYNTNATTSTGWSKKVTPIANGTGSSVTKYLYLWTCIQKKTVDGTVTYGDILLDDSTTVIDGGKIVTGSVSANKIKVSEIEIGAAQITSGTIATARIPDLSAGKITSGTLDAARIGAGSIAIGKLDSSAQTKVNNGDSALSKVNYYNRACQVGNSSNTQTNLWRKFASYTEVGIRQDAYIIFDVSNSGDSGSNKKFGRLKAHIRTVGTAGAVSTSNTELEWITRGEGISLSDFVLAYKATSGTDVKVELWARCPTSYTGYRFGMVEEGKRGVIQTTQLWTLYDDWTANGQANITSGYTQVVSTDIDAARTTATTYITHVDNNGIRIHPAATEDNSVVINASGMEVFKGGTTDEYSVAKYGDTARIGKESGSHLTLAPDSMSMSDGTKDLFNLLQKTMYIRWNRNYKGRQFANSTDRHVDSWDTNTTISTWDSIAVNYKLNNTSRTKKITSISNGVLANDEIYVHFNYSGTIITLTYGRGSSAASSDIIKLESAVVYYVTDEKLSQLHTGIYPNTTVSGALRIGNGTSDSNRRNLMLVDWSGTGKFKGDILAFCGADSSGGMSLTKAEENIDAFKYEDANGHVYIDAYRVGRIVSLLCSVSKTASTAPGGDLYRLDLTNAHLPKPLGTNTSGTGMASKNVIVGNVYYNKTVTPNKYEFVCRNGGSTAMSTGGVGFTITYICQMDEVSGEIKYMDD